MLILGATIAAACATRAAAPPVQWSEIAKATVPPADQRIAYGPDSLHYGELRIPDGDGPFPIAVVIHGGCWQSEYDLRHAAAESEALRAAGIANMATMTASSTTMPWTATKSRAVR